MPFTLGNDGHGAKVLEFKKGWNLPICCIIPCGEGDPCMLPVCCCLPTVETAAPDGSLIGSSSYLCDVCLAVPKFMVKDYTGADKFLVRPDTCCFGCCVRPRCNPCDRRASRTVYIPLFIRDPVSGERLPGAVGGDAHISKVWSGWKKECCSDADNFQVVFPQSSDTIDRANLLGATVLIDFSWFESQNTV
eukprot:CAMPEP_0119058498 /NCGR_PEP_ID=MMETSP1178-20130426/2803_1 /TAXON_ID=33656 /ORGANISM="unid sp, Strain CCMP2000" /LENGTH=190 /DNA_ID=CAMNT_0007039437 /DNA_START=75 /DNA_END=647 /DNA_ORIENTATION=-